MKHQLTLCEPVLRRLLVRVQDGLTLFQMIRSLIQNTIFKSLPQDVDDLAVDELVALELVIRLKDTHKIVGVTCIDSWNTAHLLVIPWILLLVRLDDRL